MFKDRFLSTIFFVEIWLLVLEVILIAASFSALPNHLPLIYTKPWGESQLVTKNLIFVIPLVGLTIFFLNNILSEKLAAAKELLASQALSALTTVVLAVLTFSLFRITLLVAGPQLPWTVQPKVIFTLALSFGLSGILTYPWLTLSQKIGLLDNPQTHHHPAMLLTRAIPRGGALPLWISFLTVCLLLLQPDRRLLTIFLVGSVIILIGLIDDKYDLNPYLRFSLQIAAAALLILGGLQIDYINHPLGQGVLSLTKPTISLGPMLTISPLASLLTFLWLIWTMNMISWSNGVDGQFPTITAVTAAFIGILGLSDPNQFKASIVAFALSGAALGTLAYSWHPAKMLYGFGATGVGLVLAAISILNGTKIATALLVLLVPSLDALFTILRRLRAGRSPFWGDRLHFHHRLLDLGLSQRQIALFYGLTGIVLGTLAVVSSGRGKLLAIITSAGVFIFLLFLVNFWKDKEEKKNSSSNL